MSTKQTFFKAWKVVFRLKLSASQLAHHILNAEQNNKAKIVLH